MTRHNEEGLVRQMRGHAAFIVSSAFLPRCLNGQAKRGSLGVWRTLARK